MYPPGTNSVAGRRLASGPPLRRVVRSMRHSSNGLMRNTLQAAPCSGMSTVTAGTARNGLRRRYSSGRTICRRCWLLVLTNQCWASSQVSPYCPPPEVGSRRSEEHTSELQSRENLVCRLLLEKKKKKKTQVISRKINKSKKTLNTCNTKFNYNKLQYSCTHVPQNQIIFLS